VSELTTVVMPIRDALSPSTLLDADEVGVILPDDNTPGAPQFPLIYWNAAGAMYAHLFARLAPAGMDYLGQSQLVGYPQLEWENAPPQFPSVALLNWTTGAGTARYWVLQLLLDEFAPGDAIVNTTASPPPASPFCGSIINLSDLTLTCPQGVISEIIFADYGTPTGSCGSWAVNASCSAANSSSIVSAYCLGQQSCTVPATTAIFGDPCYGTVKTLDVVAECSTGGGYQPGATGLTAQAFVSGGTGARKVLLVNQLLAVNNATIAGATGGSIAYVDESTGFGPAQTAALDSDTVTLQPFAVAVVTLPA
jgi:hypothetical protein